VEEFPKSVPGAAELFDWFGFWPDFHDAEIVSLTLNRSGVSILKIHTWEITGSVDERGYYKLQKHVIVNFQMEEIIDSELADFSSQNVVSGLILRETDDGFAIRLAPCYGLAGTINPRNLSIEIEPAPEGA